MESPHRKRRTTGDAAAIPRDPRWMRVRTRGARDADAAFPTGPVENPYERASARRRWPARGGAILAALATMRRSHVPESHDDSPALARLHAALDSVESAVQLVDQVRAAETSSARAVRMRRLSSLIEEAQEVLASLLREPH